MEEEIRFNESPLCGVGGWDQTTDLSALSDGSITITADHSDDSSNDALQASSTVIKDSTLPTVAITPSPSINLANVSAYNLAGTCSENGRAVGLRFDDGGGNQVNESPLCSMGAWDQTTDLSALNDGSITIIADHSDDSSNDALQASSTVIKDTVLPTVGIMSSPPAINAAKYQCLLAVGDLLVKMVARSACALMMEEEIRSMNLLFAEWEVGIKLPTSVP